MRHLIDLGATPTGGTAAAAISILASQIFATNISVPLDDDSRASLRFPCRFNEGDIMENPKKTRGDGIFGWPISAFTFLVGIIGVIITNLIGTDGPAYVLVSLAILVEVIHHKWKMKKLNEE